MLRLFVAIFVGLWCAGAGANDCMQYKKNPGVFINTPDWKKIVVQPKEPMNFWHGNVVATFVDNYDLVTDVNLVDGGFCVGLKSVDSVVGYNNFDVQIDIRHIPNSCEYNAVLRHEDKHIKAYLSVVDDFKADLQRAMFVAADSIMPVFVKSKSDVDGAINMFNQEFQNHPDMIVVKQKIKAAEEIRNKQVDQMESGADLDKCF